MINMWFDMIIILSLLGLSAILCYCIYEITTFEIEPLLFLEPSEIMDELNTRRK